MKKWLIILLCLFCVPLVSGVFNDSWVRIKSVCVDGSGSYCVDTAQMTVIDPDNLTVENRSACVNIAESLWSCDFHVNKTGVWVLLVNFSSQNMSREYNVVVRSDEEDAGGKMIVASVVLLPMLLGFLLILGAKQLSEDHKSLRIFLFMFAFVCFFSSMSLAGSGISNYNSNDAFLSLVGRTVRWVGYIFGGVFISYWSIWLIYTVFKGLGERKKSKLEYG